MPELKLPLDLESRSDYRMFGNALRTAGSMYRETDPLTIFCRLWFNLGYQADVTHQPGLLNENGEALFVCDLKALGMDPVWAMSALAAGRLLVPLPGGPGHFSELFARLNEHLSPKHKRSCDVGAEHSRIKRNTKNIQADAMMQQRLIPPEVYKRRDGSELSAADMTRITVIIITLDHCLKVTGRLKTSYTEGLVADAAAADAVLENWPQARRDEFYYWINDHREKPWMHRSAELILRYFAGLITMFEEGHS